MIFVTVPQVIQKLSCVEEREKEQVAQGEQRRNELSTRKLDMQRPGIANFYRNEKFD